MTKVDVAVVGGGVAGLTAAIYAAKAGKNTILIEKQDRLGGRAITNKKDGVYFNLGAHALFKGDALATFHELGIQVSGTEPSTAAYGIWKDKLSVLPTGLGSLLATPLLSWKGKLEFASWLIRLGKLDTHRYDGISLREWMEGNVQDPMARNVFYSFLRTASYVMAPDLQAAGPVLNQLKMALRGVLYLDQGWGAMIEQLRKLALNNGVRIITKSTVASIQHQDGVVQHAICEDGTKVEANHIIAATQPAVTYRMVPQADATALHMWKEQAIEITAACLDVALRHLPKPKQQFVYGIDQTVFLTNQSRAARMSEDGAHVISVLKYQGKENDAKNDLHQLEQTLDLVQPGWRKELLQKQYLPQITVCHDFMHIHRIVSPGPAVPEIKGLYVAGEWASHGELLVDAATASAKRAVRHIIEQEG